MEKTCCLRGDREATETALKEYIDYLMVHSDSEHPAWNLELKEAGARTNGTISMAV